MKSPNFSKEKLLYFPQKSGIVPIFRKSPSSYVPYRPDISPRRLLVLGGPKIGPYLGFETIFTFFIQLQ